MTNTQFNGTVSSWIIIGFAENPFRKKERNVWQQTDANGIRYFYLCYNVYVESIKNRERNVKICTSHGTTGCTLCTALPILSVIFAVFVLSTLHCCKTESSNLFQNLCIQSCHYSVRPLRRYVREITSVVDIRLTDSSRNGVSFNFR